MQDRHAGEKQLMNSDKEVEMWLLTLSACQPYLRGRMQTDHALSYLSPISFCFEAMSPSSLRTAPW